MDTKNGLEIPDDAAPPPYSMNPPPRQSSSSPLQFNPQSLTSHLHSHLLSIPDRIRQTQQAHNAQQIETDIWILDHLSPVIESFLADLGARRTAPPLATLTLIPNGAVPPDAVLSGIDDMLRRNEIGRVFRVDFRHIGGEKDSGNKYGDSKSSSRTESNVNQEFTDWGRWEEPGSSSSANLELLWWNDEDQARRLASFLQPQTRPNIKPNTISQSAVQTVVEQRIPSEKKKKGWGWGRRRSDQIPASEAQTTISLPSVSSSEPRDGRGTVAGGDVAGVPEDQQLDNGKRAEMSVTAEEVAFRRENDFGIWESMSGWAVVVAIKVYS
ncbi:hypothetical protein JX266_007394 [Neoarthrinium moseri]|nr:hypothetical protein JX266_007394 [Neoarthrinium moseri]